MRLLFLFCLFSVVSARANYIFIPMDSKQTDHLKAYGIAYWVLKKDTEVDWLLNYRGGSFMCKYHPQIQNELVVRGVTYDIISDADANQILGEIASPAMNYDIMKLEKYPKIAVYSPKSKQPWDDAVTLVLTYAEIPYDVVFDDEVMRGDLTKYDWLHLHHEDFTGQLGRNRGYRNASWYEEYKTRSEDLAYSLGYKKISHSKLAVVKKIREWVAGGGFMFAMCSATDSFDIALSAEGVDICEPMFDGDDSDPNYQARIDYTRTFAFKDFIRCSNPVSCCSGFTICAKKFMSASSCEWLFCVIKL